jgi:hypothetical protein
LVRYWARNRHRQLARRHIDARGDLPVPVKTLSRGIVVVPEDRSRGEIAAGLVNALRNRGIRALTPDGWEDYDARLLLNPFAYGELQTSSHPEGYVQVRIRFRPRRRAVMVAGAATAALLVIIPPLAPILAAGYAAGVGLGAIRARRLLGKILPAEAR